MDSILRLTSILTWLLSGLWHVGLTATNYNCDDPLASFLSPVAYSSSSDITGSTSSAQLNWRMVVSSNSKTEDPRTLCFYSPITDNLRMGNCLCNSPSSKVFEPRFLLAKKRREQISRL
ncbi:rCG51037, isoform CRA_a [Rattus norvegicus]|uniref:RCG51037, isoform CRA_a n=1 Tax=Rattus norvegicus TaxID=10116 RepID=A6KPQ7_RAT|nr:rCG51037, isoform CRA_a [Rattus norvegicus]